MNLPAILGAARLLGGGYEYLLPVAPTMETEIESLKRGINREAGAGDRVTLVKDSLAALHHSRAAIVASGTAWQGGVNPQQWTATYYPGPKQNFVFNASTIFWSQGLSHPPGHTLPWSHWSRPHGPDERVQRITHNLLRHAIGATR